MKLVSGTPYDSVLVYFPGVDDNGYGWTEENPRVYRDATVTAPSAFTSPADTSVFFFMFRAVGGVEYTLSSSTSTAMVMLYDMLDYSSVDILNGDNSLFHGLVGNGSTMTVLDPATTLFIGRLSASQYSSSSDVTVSLSISPAPTVIDTSTHYIRDWKRRIDGRGWNVAGKALRFRRLSDFRPWNGGA